LNIFHVYLYLLRGLLDARQIGCIDKFGLDSCSFSSFFFFNLFFVAVFKSMCFSAPEVSQELLLLLHDCPKKLLLHLLEGKRNTDRETHIR
jgi:hypothetical protein